MFVPKQMKINLCNIVRSVCVIIVLSTVRSTQNLGLCLLCGKELANMIFDEIAFNSFSDTKNVFIGARFNSSQNKWFWSDGTVANFSSSGLETCQQKALHYGNGWEIINKNCTGDEARFACQIGCKLKCFATTKGHI